MIKQAAIAAAVVLGGCVSVPKSPEVPEFLLDTCPAIPQREFVTNGDLLQGYVDAVSAHRSCRDGQDALRAWAGQRGIVE